jgi:hypothetical protein
MNKNLSNLFSENFRIRVSRQKNVAFGKETSGFPPKMQRLYMGGVRRCRAPGDRRLILQGGGFIAL